MNVYTGLYKVTVSVTPFKEEHEIGCYGTKELAEDVAKLVRDAFHGQANGGMDVCVKRFLDVPDGRETLVVESFNNNVVMAVLKHVPYIIGPNQIESGMAIEPNALSDQPKFINPGPFYAVVLNFNPFETSHKLYAGFYKTTAVAIEVAHFINRLYPQYKGFETDIGVYNEMYVEYSSGKAYGKFDEKILEIKSHCNDQEYLRLIWDVQKTIEKVL